MVEPLLDELLRVVGEEGLVAEEPVHHGLAQKLIPSSQIGQIKNKEHKKIRYFKILCTRLYYGCKLL